MFEPVGDHRELVRIGMAREASQCISCLRRHHHAAMAWMAFAVYGRGDVDRGQPGTVYRSPNGQHDDLGISCAMLAWAARHPHLTSWCRTAQPVGRTGGAVDVGCDLARLDLREAVTQAQALTNVVLRPLHSRRGADARISLPRDSTRHRCGRRSRRPRLKGRR